MGRRLRNKQSGVWPNFPAQNSVVVGCFSTVIIGMSMVDRRWLQVNTIYRHILTSIKSTYYIKDIRDSTAM